MVKNGWFKDIVLYILIMAGIILSVPVLSFMLNPNDYAVDQGIDECLPTPTEIFYKSCIDLEQEYNIEQVQPKIQKTCDLAFVECKFVTEGEKLYIGMKKDRQTAQLYFTNNTKTLRRI